MVFIFEFRAFNFGLGQFNIHGYIYFLCQSVFSSHGVFVGLGAFSGQAEIMLGFWDV